jgi:hypothetical protein
LISVDGSVEGLAGVLVHDVGDLDGATVVVASKQKSITHTSLGVAATGADPACRFLVFLRRRGTGTRRPSSRHSRWIFL